MVHVHYTGESPEPEPEVVRAKGARKGCLALAEMRGLKYAAMPGDFSGGGVAFADLRPAMHSWHTAVTPPPHTAISVSCYSKQALTCVHRKGN